MLFSVIIPTCHRNDLLAQCLERLAPGAQTLSASDYEVIVSDDGSRSTAQEMIATQFPWARWVAGPRRGPAANRNFGASHGAGDWLAFTDDDCLPTPGWLAAFASELAGSHDASVQVLEGRTSAGGATLSPLAGAPVNEHGGCLWSCNLAVTRSLFDRLGGFDPRFPAPHLEDVDLRLRLVDAGEEWRFVSAAEVIHPPRPPRPLFQQIKGHESSFYLAQKRHGSPADFGLSLPLLLRTRGRLLLGCRHLREFVTVAARSTAELLLLSAWWLPIWKWRYRSARLIERSSAGPV